MAAKCSTYFSPEKMIKFTALLVLALFTGSQVWKCESSVVFSVEVVAKPKPWYLTNGTIYPRPAKISQKTGIRDAALLPEEDPDNDRVLNQLMFVPPNYDPSRRLEIMKTIYVAPQFPFWWYIKAGEEVFVNSKCPVDACRITQDPSELVKADLVMFDNRYYAIPRTPKQIHAIYYTESPKNTPAINAKDFQSINWTISYRADSTIVAPYNKWIYYDERIKQRKQDRNYAAGKTKQIAWFVGHCVTNNRREDYAKELQKYIQVDIYGACGPLKCSCGELEKCFDKLNHVYKFYLAFENANCKDYITEKFFDTGLRNDIIPIVMGAPRETYKKYAPHRSYIHVEDFKSPKELAEYLHILNQNDDLYNSYFEWKGTGELIGKGHTPLPQLGPMLWCRICAMLHDKHTVSAPRWYQNMEKWRNSPEICTNGFWRDGKMIKNNNSTKHS